MKLISEKIDHDSYEIVGESIEGSHQKHWYLRGIFGQAEIINKNRRKYPSLVMNEAVERFQPLLQTKNKVYGEYHHPKSPIVNSLNACIQIQNLYMENNNMMGKAMIIPNTINGNHLIALMESCGHQPAVSTRALGDVTEKNEYNLVNEMTLITVDIVDNQSCPQAIPDMIYEDINWMVDIGSVTGIDADILNTIKREDSSKTFKGVMRDVNNNLLKGLDNSVELALMKLKYSSL